jgi:glycerate kinase
MKVLLAPDSFKGSLSAREVIEAMQEGIRKVVPDAQIDACPLADGGQGTVDAILEECGGERRSARVTGPLGGPVSASWAMLSDNRTAVIEMAAAAGLALVAEGQRDPTRTTSYGVGELIREALDTGARGIIVGVGDSATSDGGAGAAQALGLRFEGGICPMTGGALVEIRGVDRSGRDPRLDGIELVVACDVDNPLLGPQGAAAVYAPQKGATCGQVALLEEGLAGLAGLAAGDLAERAGAGAAGGLGFGLAAFCGARLAIGIELVFELVRFEQRLEGCDLVLTGEGKLDVQSLRGKVVAGVARKVCSRGVPAVAIVGSAERGSDELLKEGLSAYLPIQNGPVSKAQALAEAPRLVAELAAQVARRFVKGEKLRNPPAGR